MHTTTRSVRFSSPSIRSMLASGCLALAALSGCAPVDAAGSIVEAQTLSADAPAAATGTAGRLASVGLVEVAPSPLTPAHRDEALSLLSADRVTDGVVVPTLDRAFDPSAFSDAVGRAGSGYLPGVAALPGVEVLSTEAMQTAMFNVVGHTLADPRAELTAERSACGASGEIACADGFVHLVAEFDGALAHQLGYLARQLRPVATELQVTRWSYTLDGFASPVAITLHGRRGDSLVGVIVFR